jgi:RNA polymerase sigma-70 factor (ECF subfamily)
VIDKDDAVPAPSLRPMDRDSVPSGDGTGNGFADEILMQRMAGGDRHALGAFYSRYGGLAFALAHRMLGERDAAQDVVQEAFVALWRRAADFDAARCAPRTWLVAIVRNRCIDELRRRASAAKRVTELDAQPAALEYDPWPETWKRACGAAIGGALARLPPEQREVVELGFYSGLSHAQIAARVGAPLGTVKKRMRTGLKRLRAQLDALFYESSRS